MRKSHVKAQIVLALAFFAFAQLQLKAQDVASITGVVTDPTGAVVPGVSVTLENTLTSTKYKAVTNSVGSYTFANVPPGPGYAISFSRDGFSPFTITHLYMNVNSTRTQNAKLQVGGTSQTVEVSAAAENVTLNTTDSTIGNNFEVQFLNELPVANRDSPVALFYQQPGVTLDGAVTGARTDQTNVTVDGLEVNDNATGQFGAIVGNAPVDSVQEFRGVTAGPLSSAGQGGGGQFELVTRSGTNEFHGAVVEYHRDTDTEANDWFNNNAGVGRPPLIRNQFGGNIGGPIWKKKAFFFFDYDGRRDTRSYLVDRTVPMGTNTTGYRGGYVSYCNSQSTSTNCVTSTLAPTDVANLDPLKLGFNSFLLQLFQSRYPVANDLTGDVGDGVNTAGFRFNAPRPYTENDFVQRVDYNLNDKMKIFGRGTFVRTTATENPIQFPGDPMTYPFNDQSYAWVVGHTWAISDNKVNQLTGGETFENYQFKVTYNPQGANQYSFTGLSGPYGGGNNSQARTYPIPVVRDDFSWQKGKHSLTFGGSFKWETPNEFAAENYNFPSVGVTGNTNFTALNSQLRPGDIDTDYSTIYDDAFSTALGAFASVSSNFDYNSKGAVQQQGSGLALNYRYYETELYFGDTWKLTPDFTISYGVRYQNYTVPYETNGEQPFAQMTTGSTTTGFSFDTYWKDRIAQSLAGISTNDALPLLQYVLGGKANNAPGYYTSSKKDFAPRLAFAYSPSWDKKTVVSGGAGIIFDHSLINALQFQELQTSYLFEASNVNLFGAAGDPVGTLQTAPRFGGISSPPPASTPPVVTPPFRPYVSGGVPYGLPAGQVNLLIDPGLKSPYSITYNFGVQHEFSKGYILKVNYVGRLGRRLLATADASQLIDFPDNTGGSSQTLAGAEAAMVTQLRQNKALGAFGDIQSLDPQPWFEDMLPGLANFENSVFGGNYFANETQGVAVGAYPYPQRGDFSDAVYVLAAIGILPPNVGMSSQFASNSLWTNKGFSSYNGLLMTLHKNAGYGLQFDLNYTLSHSLDNVSIVANSIAVSNGYGFICDVNRPRECRGNSDFDVRHFLNGNFIYELPFGRGKTYGATIPLWAEEAIGGWEISGLPTWHTGLAYHAASNAFVAGFANNAPATLTGSIRLMKANVHGGRGQSVNAFSDPTSALAAYTGPTGFDIGSRNNLRGPGFFNIDLGLGKTFPIYEKKVNLRFRCDAFNAFNHANFSTPSVDITQASGVPFGTITSTEVPPGTDISARVLQGSLRLEF